MADLSNDKTRPAAKPAGGNSGPTDPRAVRVRLGAASRAGEEPTLRVTPVPEPLHMTNPTVGTGPLGGAAIAPHDHEDAGVLAQRQILVDGEPTTASIRALGGGRFLLTEDGAASRIILEPDGPGENGSRAREVLVDGFRFVVEAEAERIASLRERASQGRAQSAHSGPLQVKAIIPGKVVAVSVKPGDTVTAGQHLLVVEAMKMQNELRAPRDGTIERVGVAVGVNIEIGDLLVVIS
ncbi:MAG: biotin/lipoyl-containing protein [Chloroflexota bacterium]